MSSDNETHSLRLTGKVKWFNNKAGYGFITSTIDNEECDIFVHFSAVNVANSQYKYLVQGEYVEFETVKPDSGEHEFHAIKVSGILGGNLMCEVRHIASQERATRNPQSGEETSSNEWQSTGKRRTKRGPSNRA